MNNEENYKYVIYDIYSYICLLYNKKFSNIKPYITKTFEYFQLLYNMLYLVKVMTKRSKIL